MIPGPRPPKGRNGPAAGRGADPADPPAACEPGVDDGVSGSDSAGSLDAEPPRVALIRTAQGWAVVSPDGADDVGDLVEGMSLADLVADELGLLAEPDRATRRSVRGNSPAPDDELIDARVAALQRTVAQLEHALAARVSTERAIGVLAERHATSARSAFESMRRDARSQGRPVADLAREVLAGLPSGRHQDELASEATSDVLRVPGAPAGRAMLAQRRRHGSIDAVLPRADDAPGPSAGTPAPDGRS